MNTKQNNVGLDISRTMLAIILAFGIYSFFNQEPIAAKLLALGSSVGVLFLLIISFTSKAKSKNTYMN